MAEAFSGRRALLIGINTYPNVRPEHQLKGCIHDARAWESLLTIRFGFESNRVKVLENPTRQVILEAFEQHLIQDSRPGELVVFAFSGHGSYTWDEEDDEADGLDETIVPADGHYNPTQEPRHIRDDEIFTLNGRLLEKLGPQGFAVFIVDSCHSGSITRGVGRARFLEPELPPRTMRHQFNAAAPHSPAAEHLPNWFPDSNQYVVLSACRDQERALEVQDEAGVPHGLFGLHLMRVCARAAEGATYRNVFEEAAGRVRSANPSQHPQIEGDLDRALFGCERFIADPYLPVLESAVDTVLLGGGAAHLVVAGAQFALYPPQVNALQQARSGSQPPAGQVRVERVGPVSSLARFTVPPGRVRAGYRAFQIHRPIGDTSLPVAVAGLPQLAEALQAACQSSPLLKVLPLAEQPQVVAWAIPPGGLRTGQDGLTPPPGLPDRPAWLLCDLAGELLAKPLPADSPESVAQVCQNLEQIGRAAHLLALNNPDSGAALRQGIQLTLKRLRSQGNLWAAEDLPRRGAYPLLREGERVALEIANHSDKEVYFTVLDIGLSWRISQLHPPGGLESERLAAGGRTWLGLRPPGIATIGPASIPPSFPPSRRQGFETFKVLITTYPTGFGWLLQPGLRDPLRRSLSTLDGLLAGMFYGRGATRGDGFDPSSQTDWAAPGVTFILERKE